MKTKSKPAYCSVAVTDDVHAKLEIWRRALSDYDNRRWTFSQVIDWLLDEKGVPDDYKKAAS